MRVSRRVGYVMPSEVRRLIRGEIEHIEPFDVIESKFESICWFSFDDIPHHRSDPHMARFLRKFCA